MSRTVEITFGWASRVNPKIASSPAGAPSTKRVAPRWVAIRPGRLRLRLRGRRGSASPVAVVRQGRTFSPGGPGRRRWPSGHSLRRFAGQGDSTGGGSFTRRRGPAQPRRRKAPAKWSPRRRGLPVREAGLFMRRSRPSSIETASKANESTRPVPPLWARWAAYR